MVILTSTGRGSYVDPTEVRLDAILAKYDRCPAEFVDEPQEAVIAACGDAMRQIAELRVVEGAQ